MKRGEFIKLMGIGGVAMSVAPLSFVVAKDSANVNKIPIKSPFDVHKPIYPDYVSSWVKSQNTDKHISTGTFEETFHVLTHVPSSLDGKYNIVRESWVFSDDMNKKEIEKRAISNMINNAEQIIGKDYFDINKYTT